MKKKKLISLLLSLSIICSMMMPGAMVYAAGDTTGDSETDNGMVINKTATVNNDGSYTVQLEAYATGEKFVSQITKDVPTDIVLVLDQSGSMDHPMGQVYFSAYGSYSNEFYYDYRHNGGDANLYYPLGNGSYASVSVTRESWTEYDKITEWKNNKYYNNQNSLYALVDGTYQEVTVKRKWKQNSLTRVYTYLLNGKVIGTGEGWDGTPVFSDSNISTLYQKSSDYTYTYTYTDTNNVTQTVGTSDGADTRPNFTYPFYSKGYDENAGDNRITALKTALTNFASAVSQKAAGKDKQLGTEDDVDHRIAVVGFASDGGIEEYYYTNTELFVGAKQYRYDRNAKDQYKNAFQTMDTQIGQDNITASINALDADGGTHPDLGIKMANGILNANPVTSSDKARNRVVIMFTDGFPGDSSFDTTVADNAIKEAQITKNAGTTVYSVGIFGGADATNAGDRDSSNETVQANWFMQTVSSNNGEPQSPSYYLSASDADSLNNIFKQISDNIQSGGSSTTLNDTAVIRDIISTPFKLANEDVSSITLETYKYEGNDSSGAKKWTKNSGAMNATASVDGDKVNVTGFDYAANYVGTDTNADGTKAYHGDKLVISFNVVPKDGFLGGNDVYTNTSAGVYENADAATPVLTFNRPQVNVPIKDITVTARDKNVYLLNDLTKEQLLSDATVQVGHVSLDLTRSDYGLESWQTKYVNISVAVKDENGNAVTDLSALKEDQTYSVTVTVSPKTDGANASGAPAIEKTGNDGGTINVFKPELTYTDSTVYYGDIAPTDFSDNLKETIWKHEDEIADAEAMGAAPELSLSYTPDAAKITDGKIDSKKDVNIDAVVKIGHTDITTSTSFAHVKEAAECSWNITDPDGSPAFLLHVKTCQLTITKKNGASDEPYVFTVYKDGVKYSEVTIVGNRSETISELPVGIYTIEEDGGWSWRYSATYEGNGATLTAGNDSGSITCTNKKDSNSWLNNFSTVVKNIFGKANNKK